EALGDQLVDVSAVEHELGTAETRQLLQIEVEPHGDSQFFRLEAGWWRQPRPDLRHGADLDAPELDRGSEVEAVHRSAEVRDEGHGVPEEATRSPHDDDRRTE